MIQTLRRYRYHVQVKVDDWAARAGHRSKWEDAHHVDRIDETTQRVHYACGASDALEMIRPVSVKFKQKCRHCRLAPLKVYMDLRKVEHVLNTPQ